MDELLIDIKKLSSPRTIEEMNQQLGLICDTIEKCEKMLQHLAVSNMNNPESSSELDALMSQHMELSRMRSRLTSLKEDAEQKAARSDALFKATRSSDSNIELDTEDAEVSGLIRFFRKLFRHPSVPKN